MCISTIKHNSLFKCFSASSAAKIDCVPPSSPRSAIALAHAPRITGFDGTFNTVAAVLIHLEFNNIKRYSFRTSGIGDKSIFKLLEASAPLKP